MGFIKDPLAVLDYQFSWVAWLAESETIFSHTVTVPTGLVLDSDTEDDGVITYWLSGGAVGKTYSVTCHITTNQGRQDDRTERISIRER